MKNQAEIMRLIQKRDVTLMELRLVTGIPILELGNDLFSLVQKGQIKTRWRKNNEKSNRSTLKKLYTFPYNENNCATYPKFSSFVIHNQCRIGDKNCS